MNDDDKCHLRRAIELAMAAREAGDQPYGSLLVGPSDEVLAEDRNTTIRDRDITAHPELKLARWAARELERDVARSVTLYTSCEPCAMCANAISRSGIGRVVFALSQEQRDEIAPSTVPVPATPTYEGPALFEEARLPIDSFYN
jgi:tRNA(Arg) A34 adenosine deaminase TadA